MPWPLAGLEKPKAQLSSLLKAGRPPHALLFTGPPGGGKNSLARALAAALNCAGPDPDLSPCGHCLSCRKIARNTHPDIKTLVPAGDEGRAKPEGGSGKDGPKAKRQIGIREIRELRRDISLRPSVEGRVKVYIIREADRLGGEAASALLKTLEEPPRDSAVFLTTALEGQVLLTLRSRCQALRLPPLPPETILRVLAEGGLAGPEARLLAALSGGALGAALAALGEVGAIWERWRVLDHILGAGRLAESLALAGPWVAGEGGAEDRLALLRLWWRETLRLAALGPEGLEGPPPGPGQVLWAGRLTPRVQERVARALDRLAEGLERLPHPPQKPELFWADYWLSVLRAGAES